MNFIEREFARKAVKEYFADYESRENSEYELNAEKRDKMTEIITYCQKIETECDCKIIRCMLEPKHEQGYIQVLFSGELVLGGKDLSVDEFASMVRLCDGINITTNPVGDGLFQITFFVENLWVRKK